MPDNTDATASETETTSGLSPEQLAPLTWEERDAATAERLGPAVDISDTVTSLTDGAVDGASFNRLTEAAEKLSKVTTDNAGEKPSSTAFTSEGLNELHTLLGASDKMTGKSQKSESESTGSGEGFTLVDPETGEIPDAQGWLSGSAGTLYNMEPIGDEVVDASIAARVAELRGISEIVGIDGAALGAAAAEHYNFTATPPLVEEARQAVTELSRSLHSTYSGDQKWFDDLIGERTRTLDLLSELSSAAEMGQLNAGMHAAQDTANSVIDAVNMSSASYIEQRYAAVDAKAKGDSFWQRLWAAAAVDSGAAHAMDALKPAPIQPNYGYIPHLDTAVSTLDNTATQLSSVATNDLVGQMRDLVGTPGKALGGTDLGSADGKMNSTGGGGAGGYGGGGGMRRGGTPPRQGSSSSRGKKSSGSKEDKAKEVANKLADLFAEAGGGSTGAAAVADAAKTEGLTASQLAAAGMSPEMLAQMGMGDPAFGTSAMQGGMPLDQRLAGLGNTHLSQSGDLGGVRGALGADIGSGSTGGAALGGAGRPFSPEARASDAMLTPAPAPNIGDPVRRTALGADMRPLDQTGTGRMSPDAVSPTRQNMTGPDGQPRQVETVIEVAGQEHPITIDDPRLLEMMNIVSAEGSADSPMEILEAAKRAGAELTSYGEYIGNPLDAKPGDVVISGKGNGFYMGDGRVLMETGEIKPISEVLELRPPENGIFRLALPELPDGDAGSHKDWDKTEGEKEKAPSAGGFAPSTPAAPTGDTSFDPFAKDGGTPPPTTDAPMDSSVGPDTTAPDMGGTSPAPPTNVPTAPSEPPRSVTDLPVSDAPVSLGSSSSVTPTPEATPAPEASASSSGKISAEAVGMVEVEYEGRPLGGEPVRY